MSRCFPFPPPGYEKKARDDNIDLLAKEKHKEKKSKKEKKDKEKKKEKERDKDKHKTSDEKKIEGRTERQDGEKIGETSQRAAELKHRDKKDRKEKHREKKDRKEKHRDRDKKKEKERDKDKNKTSDEKKIEGRSERQDGEKIFETSQHAEELKNSKVLEELGKRIRDEQGAGIDMVSTIAVTDQRRINHGVLPIQKSKDREGDDRRQHKYREEDSKATGNQMVQSFVGLDQRRREASGKPEKELETGNQMAQSFVGLDQRRREGFGKLEKELEAGTQMAPSFVGLDQRRREGFGKLEKELEAGNQMAQSFMGLDQRRREGFGKPEKELEIGNQMAQSFMGLEQRRQEGIGKQEKELGKKGDGREKDNGKEADDKKGQKHRDRDKDEKKRKDKDRDKVKEKEKKKAKEKSERGEHRQKERDKLKESGKNEQFDSFNITKASLMDGEKIASYEGQLRKRKEFEMNGFTHELALLPNKLPKAAPSSHLPVENGRKLEAPHLRIPCSSDKQGAPFIKKTETNKEPKLNGVIEAHRNSLDLKSPLVDSCNPISDNAEAPSTGEARENGKASSAEHPHPDSKYLSQIYSVPKMDNWSDFNDGQEWLFECKGNLQQQNKVEAGIETRPNVWADAMQIESADAQV